MTKLLVSVRNSLEALEAFDGGAAIIDVKEPRLGSLGPAGPEVWEAVRQAFRLSNQDGSRAKARKHVTLSAAVGELQEFEHRSLANELEGFTFAKIGLAGCSASKDWRQRWDDWRNQLPRTTAPVAVVYADYRDAQSPTPSQVITASSEAGGQMLLIDTYDKRGGDLFARMTASELRDVVAIAGECGLMVALAGSLNLTTLAKALIYKPELIAVRGAVCRGGRESVLDKELVKHLALRLSTPSARNHEPTQRRTIDSLTSQV